MARAAGHIRRGFQVFFYAFTLLLGAAALLYVYGAVEQFLISDSRFALPGPPEPGTASGSFRIEGAVYASEQQVTEMFQRDFGRSVYLCPIQERRRKLLAIDWIKEASVSRLWPNRIIVRVVERTPVAFVQTSVADGSQIFSLIDEEGVLLDPQRVSKLPLPVVTGIPASDTEAKRRDRIKRFLRLQSELGDYMANVSEVDVANLENLRIVQQFDDRAITLMLGNQKFKERLETFLENKEEIRRRMPGTTILDLRLKGRIMAIGDVQ